MSDIRPQSRNPAELGDPFLIPVNVSGAAVSVIDRRGLQVSVATSDDIAARLDELQFDLGEGPQWDCVRTGRPILISDLRDETAMPWPMFLEGAMTLPVRALFTLPLTMGAVTVGAVTLYRERAGQLTDEQLSDATTIATTIAGLAVDLAFRSVIRNEDDETPRSPGIRREAHQATGMILAQLNITATDAFVRLQAHAFATGSTVQAVAIDVLERRLDFANLPE